MIITISYNKIPNMLHKTDEEGRFLHPNEVLLPLKRRDRSAPIVSLYPLRPVPLPHMGMGYSLLK